MLGDICAVVAQFGGDQPEGLLISSAVLLQLAVAFLRPGPAQSVGSLVMGFEVQWNENVR